MKKETRNLLLFFAATFVWTWVCYAPIAIEGHNPIRCPGPSCSLGGLKRGWKMLRSLSMVTKRIGLQRQFIQFCAALTYRVDLMKPALAASRSSFMMRL